MNTKMRTFLKSIGFSGMQPRETGKSTVAFRRKYGKTVKVLTESFDFQKVNTVEINLDSTPETTVTIEANGEKVYERTGGEGYLFCSFKTVETDSLKITVSPDAKLRDVTASYKTSQNRDFRVTAYICTDTVQGRNNIDEKCFDVVTDVIMIRDAYYDKDGNLTVNDDMLGTAVKNVRDAIGSRKVNVYMTFLGPSSDSGISDWKGQMISLSENNSRAFRNPKLIEDINNVIEKYDFDGIFFDYEYPIKKKYWRDFGVFLKKLKSSTDRKIGLAVSDWNLMIDKAGKEACDMYEIMQYDRFDKNGNHAPFTLAPATVEKAIELSIEPEKFDLGVPFYARPADAAGIWLDYGDYAERLGKSRDDIEADCGKVYFNSYQTVYDKTAYALAYGLGGMMVWHFTTDLHDFDHPLSLFGAMGDCINDRVL